jgi:hypothetical protein
MSQLLQSHSHEWWALGLTAGFFGVFTTRSLPNRYTGTAVFLAGL